MTDEEKKAELKSLIEEYEICFEESKYEGNIEEYKSLKETYKLLKDILNLIKKQSKEIEELKTINEEISKALDEWNNGERTSVFHIHKDKIKAKIEEVKNGTYDAKIVLQSLLEKE